jgi:integrase
MVRLLLPASIPINPRVANELHIGSVPCLQLDTPEKRGKRRAKPFIYRHRFDAMLELMAEPYASMAFVAIFTGLRVSELAALKWGDIHADKITIGERVWLSQAKDVVDKQRKIAVDVQ